MSEFAVVIPGEDDHTSFDVAAMREQLPQRWPGSIVFTGPAFDGDTSALSANVASLPGAISMSVASGRQLIEVEPARVAEASEFFAWALAFLDGEPESITLYGSDYASEHAITRTSTATEIAALLS